MSLPAVLYTLSSVPIFASRPFLAAFLTALLARYGAELPWVGEHDVVVALSGSPEWFRSAISAVVLGVLAAVELFAARSPELRQVLQGVEGLVKPAVAMLVALAVVDADTAQALDAIRKAGFEPAAAWTLVVGAATFGAAHLRRGVVGVVQALDETDALGLQSLLAWAENAWAVLGLLFLVLFPLAALVLAALTLAALALVRRRVEAAEERRKVPCVACGTPLRPHATRCPACRHEVAAPRAVGLFGQALAGPAPERAQHVLALAARKRCPSCAARLPARAVRQTCPSCREVTFATQHELERYLAFLDARLVRTLLVTAALGAVPLLGVVPAVVHYRLHLVSGLRAYLPPFRGLAVRWGVRLLHVLAVVLQPIPILGALLLPLLCLGTYLVHRRALAGHARGELQALPARG